MDQVVGVVGDGGELLHVVVVVVAVVVAVWSRVEKLLLLLLLLFPRIEGVGLHIGHFTHFTSLAQRSTDRPSDRATGQR